MATPSLSSSSFLHLSSSSFKLAGHTYAVWSFAGHPFLPMLASASNDETVRLWDLKTRRCVCTLEDHTESVNAVAFDPTGRRLASGSDDKTVKLWDLDLAKETCLLHTLRDPTMERVRAVAWHPLGSLVASGSDDERVRVWDAASGSLFHTLEGHSDWMNAVASHPTDDLLASASDDKTVRVWRWSTGESVHTLEGHADRVMSLAASASFLVSGSNDKTVRVWSWTTGLCVRVLDGFTNSQFWNYSLGWQGSTLVAKERDGMIHVWDTSDEEDPSEWSLAATLPFETRVQCLSGAAIVEGGTCVVFVSVDNSTEIAVWDFQND